MGLDLEATMSEATNLETAKRYIDGLSAGMGADELGQFYTPDVVQEEFPNRFLPNGATRDLEAMRQGRLRGQALLSAEHFDLLSAMASGEVVALECVWRATIGVDSGPFVAGQTLRARFAIFLEFRDGRIARQRNYDCFDPW
jgi:ketosteroid isomerase-like protein